MISTTHGFLPNGMEYGVVALPQRHVVSFQIRLLAGVSCEPADRLGLARLVEETIDKATQRFTGRQLSDAFDAIGAGRGSGTGRETMTFHCTVLPEHFERAVELHAEILRAPTFPENQVQVAVELAKQELFALQDDPQALADKLMGPLAYGPALGRHSLGELETLERITRDDVEEFWRKYFNAGRMMFAVAGPGEPARVVDVLSRHFDGFGDSQRCGRESYPLVFTSVTKHHHKDLKQQQIAICWPGVEATHEEFPVQQATIGILSGGMSGRLFTEVREKRGLVYWVGAWQETPRGAGMMFLGASTTPERCDLTYKTLLNEVDRLSEDLTKDELDRAVTGIVASQETRGDTTRARCGEIASDLFFFGRPIPLEEKIAKLQAVTVEDVHRYLANHPRNKLCVLTLGPRPLHV
jgi:predicted Zn-dependent peptidase